MTAPLDPATAPSEAALSATGFLEAERYGASRVGAVAGADPAFAPP